MKTIDPLPVPTRREHHRMLALKGQELPPLDSEESPFDMAPLPADRSRADRLAVDAAIEHLRAVCAREGGDW